MYFFPFWTCCHQLQWTCQPFVFIKLGFHNCTYPDPTFSFAWRWWWQLIHWLWRMEIPNPYRRDPLCEITPFRQEVENEWGEGICNTTSAQDFTHSSGNVVENSFMSLLSTEAKISGWSHEVRQADIKRQFFRQWCKQERHSHIPVYITLLNGTFSAW